MKWQIFLTCALKLFEFRFKAGKSTYMQQVCLLQILAQCGCFVPADFACFVPMNRVFSRVGHNDDLCQGLSGFAVEVRGAIRYD